MIKWRFWVLCQAKRLWPRHRKRSLTFWLFSSGKEEDEVTWRRWGGSWFTSARTQRFHSKLSSFRSVPSGPFLQVLGCSFKHKQEVCLLLSECDRPLQWRCWQGRGHLFSGEKPVHHRQRRWRTTDPTEGQKMMSLKINHTLTNQSPSCDLHNFSPETHLLSHQTPVGCSGSCDPIGCSGAWDRCGRGCYPADSQSESVADKASQESLDISQCLGSSRSGTVCSRGRCMMGNVVCFFCHTQLLECCVLKLMCIVFF